MSFLETGVSLESTVMALRRNTEVLKFRMPRRALMPITNEEFESGKLQSK